MANKIKVAKKEKKYTQPTSALENMSNIFEKEGELVVDVFENNSHFVVLAAIAGVQIKDLDISVEKDMMVIKGHRPDPHALAENAADGTKNYFYRECYWGPFSRKIILPENIHTEKTSAQMDKGMLTIKIPKMNMEKEVKATKEIKGEEKPEEIMPKEEVKTA